MMRYRKTCVIALLVLLAASLDSCIENNRETGSGMVTDDYNLKTAVKTFNLSFSQRTADSTQSPNASHLLIGSINDETFGNVYSSGASFIVPFSDSSDMGKTRILKDAYIKLSIDSTICIENSQEGIHQSIRIYEMLTPIDSSKRFCNSLKREDYSAQTITEGHPIIYGKGEIQIKLKDEYAEKLLATTNEEFEDLNLFLKRINGFYIETDSLLEGQKGGRLNYLNVGTSVIYLNYNMTDSARGIYGVDTTEKFIFGYSTAFNFFRTGASHLVKERATDLLYIESLSGIKPHICAMDLKNMFEQWIEKEGLNDNTAIILSRAEIRLPYEMPANSDDFDKFQPKLIYPFTRDSKAKSDSLKQYFPLPEVHYAANKGGVNRSLKYYSLDITSYCQSLIDMEVAEITPALDLWLAPMEGYIESSGATSYFPDNRNFKRGFLNGPEAERKPELILTYTLLPK